MTSLVWLYSLTDTVYKVIANSLISKEVFFLMRSHTYGITLHTSLKKISVKIKFVVKADLNPLFFICRSRKY